MIFVALFFLLVMAAFALTAYISGALIVLGAVEDSRLNRFIQRWAFVHTIAFFVINMAFLGGTGV